MASSAVKAISTTCQYLSEGRQELGKFKKQVEGGVADAKAIFKEVTGLWGWLQGLFGAPKQHIKSPSTHQAKPTSATTAVTKPDAKKKTKDPEHEESYSEYQGRCVHEIIQQLKVYFDAIRQLKAICRQLEEESLTTEKVADSALDLLEIQWQLKGLNGQLKQAMIYGTPQELGLGALYESFLLKHGEILELQEVQRDLKKKKERDSAWQQEERKSILVAKLMYGVVVLIVLLQMTGLYLALAL